MQNVDPYHHLSYCYPQLPAEIRSQVAGYTSASRRASARVVEPFQGPSGRLLTPPVDHHRNAPRPFPAHHIPSPPPSPPLYAYHDAYDVSSNAPSPTPYTTAAYAPSSWSSYLDPGHRLQFQKVLGSGAYGVVHLARDFSTGVHYAVKALNKYLANGQPLDLRQQLFQQTEMRLHYKVSAHPNVVSLLRIMDTRDHTYVIMEYCPEGDLFSNITERGRYVGDDVAAKSVFLQILDAVAHCHDLGVYHRDLKPENILVTEGGLQVKLADFGLATNERYATEFGCGSTFYMSPECQDQSSGKSHYACAPNDIWSLGVILVNLTCGRNPWKSASPKDSTFKAYLEDPFFLTSILPLSDELNDILGRIFEMDPCRRIKLDELRQRIIDCPQFTKPQVPEPILINPSTYPEPLSPSRTISDEGSMISDHSDRSTVPSEIDSFAEDDFSSFEVMEEDGDFSLDSALHGPIPDAAPTPKVMPKVWDAAPVIPEEDSPDPSRTSYVPALSSKPFDHGTSQEREEAQEFLTTNLSAPERPLVATSSPVPPQEAYSDIDHISPQHLPSRHNPIDFTPKPRSPRRSYLRDRPSLRGVHPWHLRNYLGHMPQRIPI